MFVQFRNKKGKIIYINPANVDYVIELDRYDRKCNIKMNGSQSGEYIFMPMAAHEIMSVLNGESLWWDFSGEGSCGTNEGQD